MPVTPASLCRAEVPQVKLIQKVAQILVSKYHVHKMELGLPGEMVDSRARAGKVQSDPGTTCVPKVRKHSKSDGDVQKNIESHPLGWLL